MRDRLRGVLAPDATDELDAAQRRAMDAWAAGPRTGDPRITLASDGEGRRHAFDLPPA